MDLAANLFTCPAPAYGNLRLLPTACAANWKRARAAQPWDRLFPCRQCPIGAAHAGEAAPDASDNPRACAFCGRTHQRLVAKIICISCANRLFELLRGSYRRKIPPSLGARLIGFSITFEEPTHEDHHLIRPD